MQIKSWIYLNCVENLQEQVRKTRENQQFDPGNAFFEVCAKLGLAISPGPFLFWNYFSSLTSMEIAWPPLPSKVIFIRLHFWLHIGICAPSMYICTYSSINLRRKFRFFNWCVSKDIKNNSEADLETFLKIIEDKFCFLIFEQKCRILSNLFPMAKTKGQ